MYGRNTKCRFPNFRQALLVKIYVISSCMPVIHLNSSEDTDDGIIIVMIYKAPLLCR